MKITRNSGTIRVNLALEEDDRFEWEFEGRRRERRTMEVTGLSATLPEEDSVNAHGYLLKKDGTVGERDAVEYMSWEEVPDRFKEAFAQAYAEEVAHLATRTYDDKKVEA
jgi:hypothetical protein